MKLDPGHLFLEVLRLQRPKLEPSKEYYLIGFRLPSGSKLGLEEITLIPAKKAFELAGSIREGKYDIVDLSLSRGIPRITLEKIES